MSPPNYQYTSPNSQYTFTSVYSLCIECLISKFQGWLETFQFNKIAFLFLFNRTTIIKKNLQGKQVRNFSLILSSYIYREKVTMGFHEKRVSRILAKHVKGADKDIQTYGVRRKWFLINITSPVPQKLWIFLFEHDFHNIYV